VDHSSDGERALALALAVAYDAAVVDLMLPMLDGLTLIQTLPCQEHPGPCSFSRRPGFGGRRVRACRLAVTII